MHCINNDPEVTAMTQKEDSEERNPDDDNNDKLRSNRAEYETAEVDDGLDEPKHCREDVKASDSALANQNVLSKQCSG